MAKCNSHSRPCLITGLTSPKGLQLNGSAANASVQSPDATNGDECRVSVRPDGHPGGPLLVKRSNLVFLPERASMVGMSVSYRNLRDNQYCVGATVEVDGGGPQKEPTFELITGGSARCRGNLLAVKMALSVLSTRGNHHGGGGSSSSSGGNAGLLITCTDLNISRALNRIACGSSALLSPSLNGEIKSVTDLMKREKRKILVKFYPMHVSPGDTRRGRARHRSVLAGNFRIYPSPQEKYPEALEVRYLNETHPDRMFLANEIYLDYGPEETRSYVSNAAAMEESERLSPSVLAEVDPQAFWSAVLHFETFIAALVEWSESKLVKMWSQIKRGSNRSDTLWEKAVSKSSFKLPRVQKSSHDYDWGIITDKEQEDVSKKYAVLALNMMMSQAGSGNDDEEEDIKRIAIETHEYNDGNTLGNLVASIAKTSELEKEHIRKGGKLKKKHRDKFFNEALQHAGFGTDALDLRDPLLLCGNCGTMDSKLLMNCSRCNGAAYCSRRCQLAARKEHKKDCDPVLAGVWKAQRELKQKSGIEIKTSLYTPRRTLPKESVMLTETSASGSVGIIWRPGQTSIITFTDFAGGLPSRKDLKKNSKTTVKESVQFSSLAELDPPLRFLLTCGPLPDIAIARSCLDETLTKIGGEITGFRVRTAGFTTLEWAAKKGNIDTVKWLCSDSRTKELVTVGCPVGWACYTGHVKIARILVDYGADPTISDYRIYNCRPLHIAAQGGQLECMKFLVDELGQDIHQLDGAGRGVLENIKTVPSWKKGSHSDCYRWAKRKMG